MADVERIQHCEQQVLDALHAATAVVERLRAGQAEGLQDLCAQFLSSAKESQAALLEVAGKYASTLPYERSTCVAKLAAQAAGKQVEGAQAQLQHALLQQQQAQAPQQKAQASG